MCFRQKKWKCDNRKGEKLRAEGMERRPASCQLKMIFRQVPSQMASAPPRKRWAVFTDGSRHLLVPPIPLPDPTLRDKDEVSAG